jgi:hypothetical protein
LDGTHFGPDFNDHHELAAVPIVEAAAGTVELGQAIDSHSDSSILLGATVDSIPGGGYDRARAS